jgi:hypothetical protein
MSTATPDPNVDPNQMAAIPRHGETSRPTASAEGHEHDGSDVVIIEGNAEQIARETAAVSPENRPADPKMGPKALRLEVLALWGLVLVLSIALGVFMNPFAGIAAFAIGTIGVMFNPVVGAASKRAEEREPIAEHHRTTQEGEVTIRTTSRRKERRFNR